MQAPAATAGAAATAAPARPDFAAMDKARQAEMKTRHDAFVKRQEAMRAQEQKAYNEFMKDSAAAIKADKAAAKAPAAK